MRQVFSYWFKTIIPQAMQRAGKRLGIRGVLLRLLISGIATVSLKPDLEAVGIVTLTAGIWIGLLLISFIIALFEEPAAIYQDQKQRLAKWEGETVEVKHAINPLRQKDRHLGLEIFNHEQTDLTSCTGILLSASYIHAEGEEPKSIDKEINPNGLALTWGGGSEGGKVTIPRAGGKRLLNLAKHVLDRLEFIFQGLHGEVTFRRYDQGYYLFRVGVDGLIHEKPIQRINFKGYIKFQRYYLTDDDVYSDSDGHVVLNTPEDALFETRKYSTVLAIKEGSPFN